MSRLLHFLRNESWNLSIPTDLVGNYKNSAFLFLWKVNKIHWHLQLISGKVINKAWRHSTFYLLGGKCSFYVFIPNLCRFSARSQEHSNMPGNLGPVSLCKEVAPFLRCCLLALSFLHQSFALSSEIQKLNFLMCVSHTPLAPLPHHNFLWLDVANQNFTLHTLKVFITRGGSTLLGRLHTAGSAVSLTPTEPRQRAMLGSGCGSCVCRNEWLFGLLSALKVIEVKKVSALTHDTRIDSN